MIIDTPSLHLEMASSAKYVVPGSESQDSADGPLSTNTGPKGVLTDFSHHQAEKAEQREQKQREISEMMKKQAVNFKQEKRETSPKDHGTSQFLAQYRAQKFMELKEQAMLQKRHFFGHLMEIRGDKYAETIDKESPDIFVVISIYEEHCEDSQQVNQCLAQLARNYPTVKFVRVQAHKVQMSDDFMAHGIPTILVYKGGNLLGNFVKITETLRGSDKNFCVEDLEAFLLEKKCLPSIGKIDLIPTSGELELFHSDNVGMQGN
ncbi:phosducin-like protein [Dysidea avara]|uniref:phosducin-like protein n=1 Tax=Dysidea avara TaxID=196820 RepID=UPI003333F05B